MGITDIFSSLKKKLSKEEEEKTYPNRFLKFYHLNKNRLNKERKGNYHQKKKKGFCVRCKRPVIQGIVFCEEHQQKMKEYNLKAREKKKNKKLEPEQENQQKQN